MAEIFFGDVDDVVPGDVVDPVVELEVIFIAESVKVV